MRRTRGACLAIILIWVGVGCSGPRKGLVPIPEPAGLAGMNASVRAQYQDLRLHLDRLLAEPSTPPSELASAFGDLGLWHHVYQLSDSAEIAYRNARMLSPDDSSWPYYSALIDAAAGRSKEARAGLQDVLEASPTDVPALVRLAEIELVEGRATSAKELFERALTVDGEAVRASVGLARAALEQGEARRAADLLQQALSRQPGSWQVRYALGLALRELGEMERAEAYLATVKSEVRLDDLRMQDPRQARLLAMDVGFHGNLRRAQEAGRTGRHQAALQFFRAASDADPTSVVASLGVSRSLHAMGRVDEALERAFETLELFPDNALVHNGVAIRLLASGRREEARCHFQAALGLRPDSLPALRGLGVMLSEDGDLEGAADYFRQARALGLTEELAERNAGALISLGRYREAREAVEQDLVVLEDSRHLTLLLARLMAAAPDSGVREGERALTLARQAFAASPGLDAAEVLVLALAELGDLTGAARGQRLLIEAVKRAGRKELLARFEQRLAVFERGQPDRDPTPVPQPLDSVFVDPVAFEPLLVSPRLPQEPS